MWGVGSAPADSRRHQPVLVWPVLGGARPDHRCSARLGYGRRPRRGRPDHRPDGPLRIGEDQGPRHSRGDRGHSLRREPDLVEGRDPEACLFCDFDRQRWPVRRGRADHHDGRRDRFAVRAMLPLECGRKEDAAGGGRCGWNDGNFRHAVRRHSAGDRGAAVRMEAPQLRAGRRCGARLLGLATPLDRRGPHVSIRRHDAGRCLASAGGARNWADRGA